MRQSGHEDGVGLDGLDRLHPAIQAWLKEHKQAQQEREAELRRIARQPWGWTLAPIPNLTERDLYRFRASSTLCHAVEKSGGKTISAEMRQGTLSFRIEGRELACKMVEKMTQSGKGPNTDWTAFNQFLKAGLRSTGFLRAAITTWLPSRQPEWTETGQTSMAQLIPLIVGRISTAVVELKEAERRRAELEARWRREEQERYDQKRRHEREEARWKGFTEAARNWRERSMLLEFLGEIERRIGEDDRRDGSVFDAMLTYLERDTARQHMDPCLGGPVDLSHISWVLTANEMTGLPAPLRSRLHVVTMEPPGPEALPVLLGAMRQDLATELDLPDPRMLPDLSATEMDILTEDFARHRDPRRIKRALRSLLAVFALETAEAFH